MRYLFYAVIVIAWLLSSTRAHAEVKNLLPARVVGAILPLSGGYADEYGAACRNGLLMAEEEHSDLFQSLTLQIEDDQYLAPKALTAFRKLTDINHMEFVIVFGEPGTAALSPLIARLDLPGFAITNNPDSVGAKQQLVQTVNPATQHAEILWTLMRTRGAARVAIVKTEDPWVNGFVTGLQKHKRQDEILKITSVLPEHSDFKPIAAKINRGNYDAIAGFLYPGQVATFFREIRRSKISKLFLGLDVLDSCREVSSAGGVLEGIFFPTIVIPDDFDIRYYSKYGNRTQLAWAYDCYETAVLAAAVLKNRKTILKGSNLHNKLSEIMDSRQSSINLRKTGEGVSYLEFPLIVKRVEKCSLDE